MTFLNDIWKKFNIPASSKEDNTAIAEKMTSLNKTNIKDNPNFESSPATSTESLNQQREQQKKSILNHYIETETEYLQSEDILKNLIALKSLIEQPKEAAPDERAAEIKQRVGIPESFETIRQERWHPNIECPHCHSLNLKRLPQLPSQSPHNHRYRCLECLSEFSDSSGTPMETGQPPMNIWMQCWYLMGCTDSLTYIAVKLNLDLATVERMAQQLQRIFNAQKPLTRFLDFDTWREQSEGQFKQLKEDLLKQYELLDANVTFTPKDSAEFRRQQTLRRTLTPTLDPTAPTRGPGKKRL